ncbi:MAG TPA: hypothetical protein VIP09_08835 [Dehalococcoidia bacterium]|jgi:hypothetical protein
MEPRILYAQTSDGVNIAYFSMGEGLPVVFVPPVPWSHLQMELADPGYPLVRGESRSESMR